jgi:Transposase IS4
MELNKGRFIEDGRFAFGMDTLQISQKGIRDDKTGDRSWCSNCLQSTNFISIYEQVTSIDIASCDGRCQGHCHCIPIPIFWDTRTECIFRLSIREEQQQQGGPIAISAPPQQLDNDPDSDSEDSGSSKSGVHSVSSSSSTSSEDEDITSSVPLGETWEKECEFQPSDPIPTQLIEEHFTATGRTRRQRMGLQCSNIEVSTPLRAWRQIFMNSLLEKIVKKYMNEYRVVHAKRWKDISRKDLESSLSVLFILGIQKRKDKPSNWFSENRLLENPLVKKLMSGRNFFNILRYLYCCPVQNQDHIADDYGPSYKIAEV